MAKYVELDKSLVNGEKHCLIMTNKEALALCALLGKTNWNSFGQHYKAIRVLKVPGLSHLTFGELCSTLESIDCKAFDKELDKWEL